MDNHKIAFIVCVNDDYEFGEALSYINDLVVPEGYRTDVIAVREAPSMAAGYNAAMKESDAKYKIYLHQDVFLIYKNLLGDMLKIFQSDESIGMIGTLGCRVLPRNAHAISRWDTGKVLYNGRGCYFHGYQKETLNTVLDVMAIDGMFMATQYDIDWREDIFDGWDFYDVSQSCEFIRNGKRVVIPCQKEYWTFHDNKSSKLGLFDEYRFKFIREYQDIYPFELEKKNGFEQRDEYEKIKVNALKMFETMMDAGRIDEVSQLLLQQENQGHLAFKELELICRIYTSERTLGLATTIYKKNMVYKEVYMRFSKLRHLIKRIEFLHGDVYESGKELIENYSTYAVVAVILTYVKDGKRLYEKISSLYERYDKKQYYEFCEYQKFFADEKKDRKKALVIKESESDEIGNKRLILIETLGEAQINEIVSQYDKEGETIFAENYSQAALGQIKRARVLNGNVVKLVAELQDSLYTDYKSLVIYGNNMEEYIKLYHETEIPVIWYVTGQYNGTFPYSDNIKIYRR